MIDAAHLRARLLMALAGASLLAPACASTASPAVGDSGATPSDQPAPIDLPAPMDVVATLDVAAPDVVTTDRVAVDAVVVDAVVVDAVVVDAGVDGSPSPTPTCSFGGAPERRCFTAEALEQLVRNPPTGGEGPVDAGADAAVDIPRSANGCYVPRAVVNDCCIPASGDSWRTGDQCCYWFCTGACCGRPFTVAGVARTAAATDAHAWRREATAPAIDDATRAALARAWADDALMEHAAIASFARFALQLLAVGAPPELVLDANQAIADEVEHARLCFTMASRYAGRAVGPGALDVGDALGGLALRDVVRGVVDEGCVGETLAAMVASAQRDAARDPMVVEALARIADDESRHAEMAWRFVAWALRVGDAGVHDEVRRAFARALSAPVAAPTVYAGVDAAAWAAHGRLDAATQRAVMQRGLREVIAPCVAALPLRAAPRDLHA